MKPPAARAHFRIAGACVDGDFLDGRCHLALNVRHGLDAAGDESHGALLDLERERRQLHKPVTHARLQLVAEEEHLVHRIVEGRGELVRPVGRRRIRRAEHIVVEVDLHLEAQQRASFHVDAHGHVQRRSARLEL